MSPDARHQQHLFPELVDHRASSLAGLIRHAIGLSAVGFAIGLACWPLNVVDRLQNHLFALLPTRTGEWSHGGVLVALLPVVVMPLLLTLQQGRWKAGSGSGIPSTINALDDPSRMPETMSAAGTVQRASLWSVATLAMLPLGREGPVVQVGASVARAMQRRWGRWLPSLNERQLVAIGGGAGLAGAFNTPLLGACLLYTSDAADE